MSLLTQLVATVATIAFITTMPSAVASPVEYELSIETSFSWRNINDDSLMLEKFDAQRLILGETLSFRRRVELAHSAESPVNCDDAISQHAVLLVDPIEVGDVYARVQVTLMEYLEYSKHQTCRYHVAATTRGPLEVTRRVLLINDLKHSSTGERVSWTLAITTAPEAF